MRVRVSVFASANKEAVVRESEHEFTLYVREPAARNLANTRVREIVAELFHVSMREVQIITGHRSPRKTLAVGETWHAA